ncbi:MAG: ComF family protein [Clostridiales bacterium]|nr:ComF family protein [Clostridiales bacterium]
MIKEIFKNLFKELFPQNFTCDLCGKEIFEGDNFCPECKKRIIKNDQATCPVCGRKTAIDEICLECKADPPKFDRAVSPLIYQDGSAQIIARFKNGEGYLKEYFCDLMQQSAQEFLPVDFVICVPMTKKAERKRGYNQAELLAKGLCKRLNLQFEREVVLKIKETEEQKSLSKQKRLENLKGCFRLHKKAICKDKTILVVDDVLTTGATSDAVCRLLKNAKAKRIYFISIASVEYKAY